MPVLYTPAASRSDAGYLDFVEGLKLHAGRVMERKVFADYEAKERDFEAQHGRKPQDFREVESLVAGTVLNRTREFLERWTQEMMWERTRATYEAQRDRLLAELDEKLYQGPGTVDLNPDLEMPSYYQNDFHIMPGNYVADDLIGYVYDYGVKVFYFGINDTDRTQRLLVEEAITIPRRPIERALDIGCGIGQDTVPIKQFLPNAHVIGLDLSAQMLKYAHKRALDQGVDVDFVQRNAEATGFPDNHFDLVFAFQLFHEMPLSAWRRVSVEALRILRPGGAFVNADIPRTANITPYRRWLREWHVRNNGEPFMGAYADSDQPAILREAGFVNVREELAYEPIPGGTFQIYFQIGEKG